MLEFICLNLVVFLTVYLLADKYFKKFSDLNLLLVSAVFYIGQVILTEEILGVL